MILDSPNINVLYSESIYGNIIHTLMCGKMMHKTPLIERWRDVLYCELNCFKFPLQINQLFHNGLFFKVKFNSSDVTLANEYQDTFTFITYN